jgi:putative membrane protein
MRFGPGPYHHGGYPILHLVIGFAFLALIVLLAVYVVKLMTSANHAQTIPAAHAPPALPAEDAALREARMRYARGEMTREEYLQVSSDLGGRPPQPTS